VPGVLAAARQPFRATGLGLPWYAVHGNHDNMVGAGVVTDRNVVLPIDWPRPDPA
jgi:DNA repair exonuclease SbcCD nuclease subunit